MKAKYQIVEETDSYLVIRDIGHNDGYASVTNAARAVVDELASKLNGRDLRYYDSIGRLDQILIKDSRFAGFVPITQKKEDLGN